MKLRRRLVLIAVLIAIVAIIAVGTSAYFSTAPDTATNVITTGHIELVLHEKTSEGGLFPKEGVKVMPGDEVSKIVTVENTGDHASWVRIKLIKGVTGNNLSAEDCLHVDINEKDWTFKDGYYYYNTKLEAGASTTPIFTKVDVDAVKVDNKYLGQMFTLNVATYGVQVANNGSDVFTAVGWPEESK